MRPNGVEDAPQFKLDIDREKASALGVSIADVNQTLSAAWGSSYVNDFIDHGRVKRVYVQGEPSSRMQPEDLNNWYVRNAQGGMVPFAGVRDRRMDVRPAEALALQRRAVVRDPGPARARPQLGRGDGHHGRASSPSCRPASASNGPALSFEEQLSGSQAPLLYALSIDRRVPVPRRALRELVDALRRAARGAARRARRAARDAGCADCRTTCTSRSAC